MSKENSAFTRQVSGDHYLHLPIQPMEYSMANGLDACQHTAIKYITRFREKGGIQDLEKAKHVIDMLIEFEQRAEGKKREAVALDISLQNLDKYRELYVEGHTEAADPFGPRDADGWYAWHGDETMRPAGVVDYGLRSGGEFTDLAGILTWTHIGCRSDIVKWRPAGEAE